MSEEKKQLIVTMTGKPPVKINKADWPIIAESDFEWYEGEYKLQANRSHDAWIRVRKHADGRLLVYGYADYETRWQNERGWERRAGTCFPPDADPAQAINDVVAGLEAMCQVESINWLALRNDCIASLPAIEI